MFKINIINKNIINKNSNLDDPGHPVYEPEIWNANEFIRKSHNCYSYALNIIDADLANRCKLIINKNTRNNRSNRGNRNRSNRGNRNHSNRVNRNRSNKRNGRGTNNRKKPKTKNKKRDCALLKPQPGAYSKTIKKGKYNCKKVTLRMFSDNPVMKPTLKHELCPNDHYLIALACIPDGSDYHFYRQDASGLWSHKTGGNPARNVDENNNIIYDPETADRGRYKIFCGYFTLPNDSRVKHMQSRN